MPEVRLDPPVVLVVVDIQRGCSLPASDVGISHMPGWEERLERSVAVVDAARRAGLPVVFLQEVHRPSGIDFGRELDGAESVHCLEGDPGTDFFDELRPRAGEYHVVKSRYSGFFATELDLLLRAHGAKTLVLIGGLTNVCVHYTFVDAHQRDYRVRVVEDAVGGSSLEAHEAALEAMSYLQHDARCSSADLVAALERLAVGGEAVGKPSLVAT